MNQKVEKSYTQDNKKLTEDLDVFGFNTSISFMMELVNELYKLDVSKFEKESDKAVLKETF